MKSSSKTLRITMTVLALLALAACDAKEREALRDEVSSLQTRLATTETELHAANLRVTELQGELQVVQDELVSVGQARDQSSNQVQQLTEALATLNAKLEAATAKVAVRKK